MDDRSSSVNAVSNSSRRVSALQESDVQILLFCSNGGAGRGGGGGTNRLRPKRLQVGSKN